MINQLQPIDADLAIDLVFRPVLDDLRVFWTNNEMRNKLSWDQLTELDFLRHPNLTPEMKEMLNALDALERELEKKESK